MKIEFLVPAQVEFEAAVAFYNSQKEGLGLEFAEEIKKAIGRIVRYPEAWSFLSKRTRRCQTKRFPYRVGYHVAEGLLLIVAVMHLRRKPRKWETRISSFRSPEKR